jgi:HK97 family phage prohead protease
VWSHQFTDPESFIGEYTKAEETDAGLLLTGLLDIEDNPRAARVHKLMKTGRVVEFSVSGVVTEDEEVEIKSADGNTVIGKEYHIKKLDLWEAGPCFKGANSETQLVSVKSVEALIDQRLNVAKEGKVLAAKHVATLKDAHGKLGDVLKAVQGNSSATDAKPGAGQNAAPGKNPFPPKPSGKKSLTYKAVQGSYEQAQQAIRDAISQQYEKSTADDYVYAYPMATFGDSVVFRVSGGDSAGQWQATYTLNDDGTVTLGTPERVNLVEQIIPVASKTRTALKSIRSKASPAEMAAAVAAATGASEEDVDMDADPNAIVAAIDATLDEATELLGSVDATTLPPEVQQAIGLIVAAEAASDGLMDLLGIVDPDDLGEDDPGEGGNPPAALSPATGKSALAPNVRAMLALSTLN